MKRVLLSLVFILSFLALNAQSTGWLNPSVTKLNNSVASANNVFSSDNQRATWNDDTDYADYGNFNITLPAGAIVTVIQVRLEGSRSGVFPFVTPRHARVSLSWNDGTDFTNYVQQNLTTTETAYTLASSNDWGHSWTSSQLDNTNFRVRLDNNGGSGNMLIDHLQVNVSYIICNAISSFPYIQNFDSWAESPDPGATCTPNGSVLLFDCWLNASGDAIDWDINSGATGTNGTGPSGDHTSGAGKYLYTEASGGSGCNNVTGIITTPIFDFTGITNPELGFWYHMNGANIGSLSVQVSADAGASWSGNIWSLNGDQVDSWQQASAISLASYAGNPNVRLRFIGQTGNGFESDMAIDDVSIVDAISLSAGTLNDFGDVCTNATGGPESFTITGINLLSTQNVTVAPLTGFTFSTTPGGPYLPELNISQSGGSFNQIIYVMFNPTIAGSYNGNISVGGGGALSSVNVAVTANAITAPVVASSSFPLNGATDVCYDGGGAVSSIAWNAVISATSYDLYFGPGAVPSTLTQNVLGTSYNTGALAANTTYYWKVVPKNACGSALGAATWSFSTAINPCSDDYCDITFAEVRSITRVDFGTINNYSSPLTGSPIYENYTHLSTDITAGTNELMTIEGFTNGNNQFFYTVYFDWNQDGDFTDSGESYNIGTITNSTGVDGKFILANILIPTGASGGLTTMRVIGSFDAYISAPCGDFSGQGQIEDYSVNVIPCTVGDPSVFGNNEWNVYAYNGDNLDLSGISYAGYYTESNLTFNSQDRWGQTLSPSNASGYQGCAVTNDNHTVVYKRTNFTCGIYKIDITSHDDAVRLYIDGVQVFEHIGCCDIHNNVWTGQLDANSTVELRVVEQVGGSNGALTFTLTPTAANFNSNVQVVQTGGVVNFLDESSGQIASYSWAFAPTSVTYVGGTNSNSPNPQVQFNGLGYYTVALTVTDACGAINTKNSPNYILVSNDKVFDTDDTFIVPCGITSINVEAWGGGGAGGGSSSFLSINSGSGGQGGAYTSNTITVTPGAVLTIDVANSVSGVNNGNGNNGQPSTILGFESQISAAGGLGGLRNASTSSPSGPGGAGANGGGAGGSGVTFSNNGNPGAIPGGGGSGSCTGALFSTVSRTGGNGAGGRIIISWGLEAIPPVVTTQDITVQLDASGNASITTDNIDNGSFDECSSPLTLALDITSFNCSNVGPNTVILTATDTAGNVASATAVVTVEDNVLPNAIAQDIIVQLDASGNASITPAQVNFGSNDACGIASLSVAPDSFDCLNVGSNAVTLTVTDNNGNISTTTATVTVEDVIVPELTAEADQDVNLDATCSITVPNLVDGSTATDNCTYTITQLPIAGTVVASSHYETIAVTITATDATGNTDEAIVTLTAKDVLAPELTAEASQDVNLDATCSITVPNLVDGSMATDNCTYTITQSPIAGTLVASSHNGTVPITVTATDAAGNTDETVVTLTAKDVTAPELTAEASQNVNLDANCSITVPNLVDGSSATDNCTYSIIQLPDAGDVVASSHNGTVDVTVTATDAAGNTVEAIVTLTAKDVTAPELTAAANQDVPLGASCSIVVPDVTGTATDNCAGTIITQIPLAGTVVVAVDGETINVTVTATDLAGNTDGATVTLTAQDVTLPTAICKNEIVYLDANGDGSITAEMLNNGSFDNCGIASITASKTSFDCSDVTDTLAPIPKVVISQVYGGGGLSGAPYKNDFIELFNSGTTTVNLSGWSVQYATQTGSTWSKIDLTNFNLQPGQYYLMALGSNGSTGVILPTPNAIGTTNINGINGKVLLANTTTPQTGGCPSGAQIIDFVGYGTANCSETAAITGLSNATAAIRKSSGCQDTNNNSQDFAIATPTPRNTATTLSPCFIAPPGTPVILSVTDVNGNVANCTAYVTVVDNIAPIIACVPNAIRDTDPGQCNYTVQGTEFDATFSDNCDDGSIINNYNNNASLNGAVFQKGATTVIWTVDDGNGQTATCTTVITVEDNEDPVITCRPNAPRDTDPGVCTYTIQGTEFDASFTDNCITGSITNNINGTDTLAGVVFAKGATTVTWIVDDGNGQTATCTTVITVEDNEDPVITCVPNATRDTDSGLCTYTVQGTEFDATFTDNCLDGSISNDYNNSASLDGAVFPKDDTIVTWTVDDGNGQIVTCTTTITIEDNEAPIVNCLSLQVQLDEFGNGSIAIDDIDGDSYDNCEIASITLSQTEFDCSDIGGDLDELIISEYSDGSGNNDCIEIYNGTGNAIDLYAENYKLRFYANGSSTPTSVTLLGTIADRDVYVICNPFGPGASQADQTGAFGIDGNDAIALVHNEVAVDIFGEIGDNPSPGWSSGAVSTAGTTLVRNENVLQGNINSFLASIETEWTVQNNMANLGSHNIEITALANNVILTVTDTSGNVSTCEGNVTVVDYIAPVAICQAVTVQLDANGEGSITASQVDNGSNDACGIQSLALDITEFTCDDVGANTVTLTVTDVNGNSSTCTATVTVEDNVDPIALTQNITVQLDASGNVSIAANDVNNGSNDACGISSLTVFPHSFTCSEVGDNTVTLTVTDNNNNVSTATATVTVEDNVDPIAICQDITVTLDVDGIATITGADVNYGSNDACGIASLEVSPSVFGCADIGENTVTLTVTDNNGNVSTCSATVTVTGIIPVVSISQSPLPEFCQGAVLVLTADSDEAIEYLWTTGETTQSIEVPGNGTYGVTVTSLTNCSTDAEITITGFDAGALVSSYTIIASEIVVLKNNVIVQTGGVGVTDSDGEIKLDKASHIVGLGQADEIEIKSGCSVGTPVYEPANPIIPAFVYNAYSMSSSPDVNVNNNQTVTLNGGVYDKVEIQEDATVIFTAPNVYINELKTKKRSTIEFAGCTNLFLKKELKLDERGVFNSNGYMVTVYVNENLVVEKGSNFKGRVHTNDHEVKVKGENNSPTYMTGMFIGKKVEGDKNVIWNADTNCDPCPIEAPQNNGGSEPTNNYTIIGFDEVHLHGDNIVQTGGVGVTRHNKKIKLHDDTHVTAFAKASRIQINGGSSAGSLIYSPADPIIPLFVRNVYSNGSSPDATINNGQTVTLTGSVYDRVDVREGATVIFTKSNVYINELKTHRYATIRFSGCTNVFINKKFKLEDYGVINPQEHKVVFYVDDDVDIKKGSVVVASIYAYGDDIKVDGSNSDPVSMKGLFIAKKVHAHQDVLWNKDMAGSPCPVVPPSAQAPTAPENLGDTVLHLTISAWPNPSDTEFNVRLNTENTTDLAEIKVFDMNNKLVHTDRFKSDQVYRFGSNLQGGVYIVKVMLGNEMANVRLIKY